MRLLSRLIPSRSAIYVALMACAAVFLAWVRVDARKAERAAIREKEFGHVEDIWSASARARRDRANGVRPHANKGWRD